MKISGIRLAKHKKIELLQRVSLLLEKGVIPQLMIIKSLQTPEVENFIRQKVKTGTEIGIKVTVEDFTSSRLDKKRIHTTISKYNELNTIHGIILQKPSRDEINIDSEKLISLQKDVDSFLVESLYDSPVFKAVHDVLSEIFTQHEHKDKKSLKMLLDKKKIVVIGKGKTGGGAVIQGFQKRGINVSIVDTKTDEKAKKSLIKNADIVISAVGKDTPIDPAWLHVSQILIDIGVHFEHGTIKGDFKEEDIVTRVAYYTTTPGGIGPLTVTGLLESVIESAERVTNHD